MQKYLKNGKIHITIEERQLVFKLRAQVTNVKMNFKGMYQDFLCEICNEENESQEHIIKCKKIEKNYTIKLDFSKIFNGNVNQMVEVARKFKENIEIRDRIKQ